MSLVQSSLQTLTRSQGRQLLPGDYIEIADPGIPIADYCLPVACIPSFDINELYVLRGPHDSPDLIVPESIESLYNSSFTVDLNSSRTGVRLVGPSPSWARKDGGEGGTHPSNLVDYPYPSPGGVNWTGDSACIFPVDGPDLVGIFRLELSSFRFSLPRQYRLNIFSHLYTGRLSMLLYRHICRPVAARPSRTWQLDKITSNKLPLGSQIASGRGDIFY